MKVGLTELLLLGGLAGLGNVLGGLVLLPSEIYRKFRDSLGYILALSAGFMMAVIFAEILPKIIRMNETRGEEALLTSMILFLFGYLLTHFLEHTLAPHFHLGEEIHGGKNLISTRTVYAAIGGLTVHTFFDGVSITAASMLDYKTGLMVFIAVFLHKIPEGFTVASMVLAAGKGYRQVLSATTFVGFTTLLGVLLFYFFGEKLGLSLIYILPIACGITLYVAASDLIPEVNHHGGKRPLLSLSVFAGVALFFLLHIMFHATFKE